MVAREHPHPTRGVIPKTMEFVINSTLAVMPSWPVLLMIWVIVILGAMIQTSMGMGFGLTVGPLLALLDPSFVPGATLVLGMFTAFLAALPERKAIRWNEVGYALVGRISGVLVAVLFLSAIRGLDTFLLAFGVMILLALLLSISGWQLAFNRGSLAAMGAISGLMGTITSVGAPPLAMIYQNKDPVHARPTLSAFFAIGCLVSIIGLMIAGWFSHADIYRVGLLLPAMLLGTLIGRKLVSAIDRRYRYALWMISGIAAVQLIIRGLS
jgi:uncharacterized membrane protein YfcA